MNQKQNQSVQWCNNSSSLVPKKFKMQQQHRSWLVLDNKDIILLDSLENGCNVNSEQYINTLKKLREAIRKRKSNRNLKSDPHLP